MTFAVYVPEHGPAAASGALVLGLTCTHANVMEKGSTAGLRGAGHLRRARYEPPRGRVPDDEAYDFAQGAGFYVNATGRTRALPHAQLHRG